MSSGLIEEIAAGHAPGLLALTVDQFQQMIREGVILDGAPIELIDGLLVHKDRSAKGEDPMGYNPRHALLISRLLDLIGAWAKSLGHYVRVQLPVTLTRFDQPEPDLALVVGTPEFYRDRHPGPGDIAAAFEISDSSLRYDRTTKQRLYARAGIPHYWIVNLSDNQIEVYDQPAPGADHYQRSASYVAGQTLGLAIGAQSLDIDVGQLLS